MAYKIGQMMSFRLMMQEQSKFKCTTYTGMYDNFNTNCMHNTG